MVERTRIIRKADEDVAEEDVAEEDVAEEVDVEEATDDDAAEDVEEYEDDDTPPAKPARKIVAPPPAAKKPAPVAAKPAPKPVAKPAPAAPAKKVVAPPPPAAKKVVAPPAKVHPVAAPAPKPMLKKVAAPVEDDEDEPAAPVTLTKVKKVDAQLGDMLLAGIVNHLNDHQAITVTRLDDGKYTIALADAKAVASTAGKLVGQAYWNEVCTPEYLNWQAEWKALTTAEKMALCKKAKVTWERYENAMVDNIHMTDAYRTAMGIEKYKDEYKTQKAREAIRG